MGDAPKILVIEDDLRVVQGLIPGLRRAGFDVSIAMDGLTGTSMALVGEYALIVLDLMLPGRSGYEVLDAVAGRIAAPVIVLSARTELEARLGSFAHGAVDYVAKPFFIEELVARIRARLGLDAPHRVIRIGGCTLDLDARKVTRDGEDLGLTGHELNVLAWLVTRPGRAVSRAQLAEHALEAEAGDRTVDSHVSRVRKKLGPDGDRIETVWGIGYRFTPEGA